MLIKIDQQDKLISDLKKKRNSLYARIETLKLRGPNRDQKRIDKENKALLKIEQNLSDLSNHYN